MPVTIVTWNMGRIRAKQTQAWAYCAKTSGATVALLQEGLDPPRDKSVWKDWVHYDGRKMGWGCGVVAYGCQVHEFKWEKLSIDANTLVVAEMVLPKQGQIIVISLYGEPDRNRHYTPDLHQKLSDLAPILEDSYYRHRVILGGDFNISIKGPGRRANKILFDRIKDFGLVDCLARFHTVPISTHRNSHGQASWQLDYLFASEVLTQHLTRCDVIDTPEVHGLSDHNPIVAEFNL